jgi:nucleoside-diphosphate-sugar epimerase
MSGLRCAHLIVTGGSGYVGSGLVELALQHGRRVTVLARGSRGLPAGVRHVEWSLGDEMPPAALAPDLPIEVQALIHLAHDWRGHEASQQAEEDINLAGTRRLVESFRRRGSGRIVFISSQSARPDALNAYGRTKWLIEQGLDRQREVSLRVGLVYGGPHMAMYGLIRRLVAMMPILPMIEPQRLVQPIQRAEVARGILFAADADICGPIGLASPDPVAFGTVLRSLAQAFQGRRLHIIPVPLRLALLACDLTARLPFLPSVDRERVLGLAGTRPFETRRDLDRLGLELRPMPQALLDEAAARKTLLAEGRALLSYVLRQPPGGALVRRYARAVLSDRVPCEGALRLPSLLRHVPSLLRFIEPLRGRTPFARRLRLATSLAEASPEGEQALMGQGRRARLAALAFDLVLEGLALPSRLVAEAFR